MTSPLKQATRYYATYEEREQAFRASAFALIPRKHLGPEVFWNDFQRISINDFSRISRHPITFITSNPRDCLAFGTARQVLNAARAMALGSSQDPPPDIEKIAEIFDIVHNLQQPIRTLSGGETVKVALAKSYLAGNFSRRLAIASPFCWLSRRNIAHLEYLMQHYRNLGKPLDIYALADEDSENPLGAMDLARMDLPPLLAFGIRLHGVNLGMGTSINTLYSRVTRVRVADFKSDLMSPCLLVGENGQGKSLVSKILSGAIPFSGDAAVTCRGNSGRVRLLFQDVINQTLFRSFDVLRRTAAREGGARQVEMIYSDIMARFMAGGGHRPCDAPASAGRHDVPPRSLLEIKALLVALRLGHAPGAILLDEPDWGLSRSDALSFVAAIINTAHAHAVPVLIISHKPWWRSLAASRIDVRRTPTSRSNTCEDTFDILLHCQSEVRP